MRTVPLHGRIAAGRVALVDDADYELVMGYRWNVRGDPRPGRRPAGPYAMTHVRRDGHDTTLLMHNLIMGRQRIDHRNHDGLDNQRANLRPATSPENSANARPQSGRSSKYKGVHWHKGAGKWVARITRNGSQQHLGTFASEMDAALAYDTAAPAVFGEYCCLNFPAGYVPHEA